MLESTRIDAPDIGVDVPRLDVDPFDVRHLREPYALQKLLRDAGPVVWLERYGTYGAAGHAEVQQILQDPAHFSSAAGVGLAHLRRPGAWREPSPLVESDPPQHTVIRRTMDQILAPSVIREWRTQFTLEAERLCDSIVKTGTVDGVRDLAQRYVHTAFPSALGIESHPENLLIVGHHNANAAGPRNALFEETLAALESIKDWYLRHQTREAMLPGGFGERVFDAEAAGALPTGVAGPVLRTLLRGGLDTTISGIASTLWLFADPSGALAGRARGPGAHPRRLRRGAAARESHTRHLPHDHRRSGGRGHRTGSRHEDPAVHRRGQSRSPALARRGDLRSRTPGPLAHLRRRATPLPGPAHRPARG